ncbi:MAG: alpha/beta hydrolase [Deltaproteobacteria bacterium]|nr:alpha/beta hydrolase [Deltaproteobacteria bacterium]
MKSAPKKGRPRLAGSRKISGETGGTQKEKPAGGSSPVQEVFVFVHGLNQCPSALDEWAGFFRDKGYGVEQAVLPGHQVQPLPPPSNVSAASGNPVPEPWPDFSRGLDPWLAALDRAALTAAHKWPGAELSLFGYSLGGVLGLVWAGQTARPLSRAVLISPPFRLRCLPALALGLLAPWLPGRLPIPSLAPRKMRVHGFTPVGAYRILSKAAARLQQAPPAHIPRFVVVHPQDELISTRFLEQQEALQALNQPPHLDRLVNFHRLDHLHRLAHPWPAGGIHHLATGPQTMGRENWASVTAALKDWLANPPL